MGGDSAWGGGAQSGKWKWFFGAMRQWPWEEHMQGLVNSGKAYRSAAADATLPLSASSPDITMGSSQGK